MSVVERLEIVRTTEGLNKSQFERKLKKSTGYLNMLLKRDSNPGVDVIAEFSKEFPNYSLNWILTGEGEMLRKDEVQEPAEIYQKKDILKELAAMKSEMQENFEAVNGALVQLLKGDNKLQRFVEGLTAAELQETAKLLQEYLKDKQIK